MGAGFQHDSNVASMLRQMGGQGGGESERRSITLREPKAAGALQVPGVLLVPPKASSAGVKDRLQLPRNPHQHT